MWADEDQSEERRGDSNPRTCHPGADGRYFGDLNSRREEPARHDGELHPQPRHEEHEADPQQPAPEA